jgi:hypothetical protein
MSNPDQAPGYDGEPTSRRTSTTSTSAGARRRSHRPSELPPGPGGTYSPGPERITLARSTPTGDISGLKNRRSGISAVPPRL